MKKRPRNRQARGTPQLPSLPSPLGEAERSLFRAAVTDVTPIKTSQAQHQAVVPLPIPRQRELDEAAALHESWHGSGPNEPLIDLLLEGGDEPAWARTGVQRSVLRDLRRGRWAVEAFLDLHGHTRDEARLAANQFIAECMVLGKRCVRIVHGKGFGSPGREPVLKKLVLGWLTQKREVLAFCQARTIDGGAGAVIVLLQTKR